MVKCEISQNTTFLSKLLIDTFFQKHWCHIDSIQYRYMESFQIFYPREINQISTKISKMQDLENYKFF